VIRSSHRACVPIEQSDSVADAAQLFRISGKAQCKVSGCLENTVAAGRLPEEKIPLDSTI
jgi:hypothetical protein